MHRSIVENDDDVKRRRDGLERQSNLVVAGDFRVMRDRRRWATLGRRVGLKPDRLDATGIRGAIHGDHDRQSCIRTSTPGACDE
jgi:hypothetical protein